MAPLHKTQMYTETHLVKDVLSCCGSEESGGTEEIKGTGATIYMVYVSRAPVHWRPHIAPCMSGAHMTAPYNAKYELFQDEL